MQNTGAASGKASAAAYITGTYLGHKGRSFDVHWAFGGSHLMSSSEDGTVAIWNANTKKIEHTLVHNKAAEALRCGTIGFNDAVNLYSCGSDGNVIIWHRGSDKEEIGSVCETAKNNTDDAEAQQSGSAPDASVFDSSSSSTSQACAATKSMSTLQQETWNKLGILDHGDRQVYGFESLSSYTTSPNSYQASSISGDVSKCITIADETCNIWDINTSTCIAIFTFENCDKSDGAGGVKTGFGGPRNPENMVYLFDIKKNPLNFNVLAVARSDNTMSLIDVRDPRQTGTIGQSTLSSHPTSISWKSDGLSMLISLGSGEVSELDLRMEAVSRTVRAHSSACFGASYYDHGINSNSSRNSNVSDNSNNSISNSNSNSDNSNDDNSSNTGVLDSVPACDRFVSWSSDGSLSCTYFTNDQRSGQGSAQSDKRVGFYSLYSVDICADGSMAVAGGYSSKDSAMSKMLGTPIFVVKPFASSPVV